MEINWRNIAEMAYAAYLARVCFQDHYHNPLPPEFAELPGIERDAWIAAVKTACDVYGRAVTA